MHELVSGAAGRKTVRRVERHCHSSTAAEQLRHGCGRPCSTNRLNKLTSIAVSRAADQLLSIMNNNNTVSSSRSAGKRLGRSIIRQLEKLQLQWTAAGPEHHATCVMMMIYRPTSNLL